MDCLVTGFQQVVRAEVGGHDDDHVAEVHGAALAWASPRHATPRQGRATAADSTCAGKLHARANRNAFKYIQVVIQW